MTQTATEAALKVVSHNDELFHRYCCDEDRALCGSDLTGVPETDGDGEQVCAVCDELEGLPCEECGDLP